MIGLSWVIHFVRPLPYEWMVLAIPYHAPPESTIASKSAGRTNQAREAPLHSQSWSSYVKDCYRLFANYLYGTLWDFELTSGESGGVEHVFLGAVGSIF